MRELFLHQLFVCLSVQLDATKQRSRYSHPYLKRIEWKLQVENSVSIECKVGEPLVDVNVGIILFKLDIL